MVSVYDEMKSQSFEYLLWQLLAETVATVQNHNADMQLYCILYRTQKKYRCAGHQEIDAEAEA